MLVKTESGSVYHVRVVHRGDGTFGLVAYKCGQVEYPVVGVYPDRLPHVEATVKVIHDRRSGTDVGYNENGKVTCRFYPVQLKVGMILVNRKGLRSTRIVSITE